MKKHWGIGIVVLCTAGLGAASPASAQGPLDRLESGIRNSNGQTVTAVAAPQRVYLVRLPTTRPAVACGS